jgi:hypothetical protein
LPVAKPAQTLTDIVKAHFITFAAVVDVGLEAASRHVQLYLDSLDISYRKYRYSTGAVSLYFFFAFSRNMYPQQEIDL